MGTLEPYKRLGEVYDQIHGRKQDFYEGYLEFVEKAVNDFEVGSVLEMACGTGNLMEIFEKNGYDVEGFDISNSMLGVAESKDLSVYKQDLKDFKIGRKYDLLICIYDSLNYLEDLEEIKRCFESSVEHLNEKGYLIFDLNSKYFIEEATKKWEGSAFHYELENHEVFYRTCESEDKWVLKTMVFEEKDDGFYEKFVEKHVEQSFELEKVKELVRETGLELEGIYSSLEFEKVDEESKRWFFVCKKK